MNWADLYVAFEVRLLAYSYFYAIWFVNLGITNELKMNTESPSSWNGQE
jgi:hypothetical protein